MVLQHFCLCKLSLYIGEHGHYLQLLLQIQGGCLHYSRMKTATRLWGHFSRAVSQLILKVTSRVDWLHLMDQAC